VLLWVEPSPAADAGAEQLERTTSSSEKRNDLFQFLLLVVVCFCMDM
jgi:nitrate reductase NapE component